jgi:hypothetical protein
MAGDSHFQALVVHAGDVVALAEREGHGASAESAIFSAA